MGHLQETKAEALNDHLKLYELIDLYERANTTLRNAIEQNLDEQIEQYDRIIGGLTEQLMSFECQTEQAEKVLIKFLLRNFSFPDTRVNTLSSRACSRVMGSWLLET